MNKRNDEDDLACQKLNKNLTVIEYIMLDKKSI